MFSLFTVPLGPPIQLSPRDEGLEEEEEESDHVLDDDNVSTSCCLDLL